MSDLAKLSFHPPAPGTERAPPYVFYVERLFDAVKQVGTANSSGLFGGIVAMYYFGAKSPEMANLLKGITAVYLAGVFFFAFSYSSFATFFINQEPTLSGTTDYVPGSWRYLTGLCFAMLSFLAWLFGSFGAAYALYSF